MNTDEAAAFAQRNAEPLAQLRTFIDFAEGFTLALAEVDFRADADALWTLLRDAPGCEDVQMVGLWLGDPGMRFLRDELADCMQAVVPQPGKRRVLVVGGLERSILIHGELQPLLKDLNFVRDAYCESVPYPLILVLPRGAMERLVMFAPDFWAWQSCLLVFESLPQRAEAARAELAEMKVYTQNERAESRTNRLDLLQRLLKQAQNPANRRDILQQLDLAWYFQRDYGRAEESFAEARRLSEALGDRYSLAFDTGWLGDVQKARGNWETAERLYRQSLAVRTELGDLQGVAEINCDLGTNELERGNLDQAEQLLTVALAQLEAVGYKQYIAECNFRLAQLWQRRQQPERAQPHYTTARDLYRQLGAAKDLERIEREWEV